MMNYVWGGIVIFSVVCALIDGGMGALTSAIIDSGEQALTIFLGLYGMMALWGGLMKIAESAGVTDFIARIAYPFLRFLFPKLKKGGREIQAISMNITANLFGIGNAATPLGIDAMRKLQLINPDKNVATDEMIVFVVMNSASMRLIPTTVAMLRANHGSKNPMEILLPSIITSACALTVGLICTKLYGRFCRRGRV
ncbi:MAG: spore maturation protein A [Clostridia bacterium]|nr:spore maturation protein A [Clostridia bacterium]